MWYWMIGEQWDFSIWEPDPLHPECCPLGRECTFAGLTEGTAHLPGIGPRLKTKSPSSMLCALLFQERDPPSWQAVTVPACRKGVARIDMLPDQVERGRFDWCWALSCFLCQVLWRAMAAAKSWVARADASGGLDGNLCFSCCDSLASRAASAACSRSRGRGAAKTWPFGGHIRGQAGQPRCRWCRPRGSTRDRREDGSTGKRREMEPGRKYRQCGRGREAGHAETRKYVGGVCRSRPSIFFYNFPHWAWASAETRRLRRPGSRGSTVLSSRLLPVSRTRSRNGTNLLCMFPVRQEQGVFKDRKPDEWMRKDMLRRSRERERFSFSCRGQWKVSCKCGCGAAPSARDSPPRVLPGQFTPQRGHTGHLLTMSLCLLVCPSFPPTTGWQASILDLLESGLLSRRRDCNERTCG